MGGPHNLGLINYDRNFQNRGAENESFERLILKNEITAGEDPINLENFDLESLIESGSKFHRYE